MNIVLGIICIVLGIIVLTVLAKRKKARTKADGLQYFASKKAANTILTAEIFIRVIGFILIFLGVMLMVLEKKSDRTKTAATHAVQQQEGRPVSLFNSFICETC